VWTTQYAYLLLKSIGELPLFFCNPGLMVLPDYGCSMTLYASPASIPSLINSLYFPEADRGPVHFHASILLHFLFKLHFAFQYFSAEQTMSMSIFSSLSCAILAVKAN